MKVTAVKTSIFAEGDDLIAFIQKHVPKLREGSIIAISSKVVALSEGRTAPVAQKEALIKKESSWRKKVFGEWWLTVRDGVVIVNAGIDESNAVNKLVLLPKDSYTSAQKIYSSILQNYKIRNCGVVITDSRVEPLRAGVTGVALGYAGFRGVRDYRGKKDIFGKTLEVTQTNVADSLATAATLVMGEGSEQQPIAIIEDAPVEFVKKVDRKEIAIPMKQDMYRRLFK
jgi:coenzyme F420-0:L-glutamate ligase